LLASLVAISQDAGCQSQRPQAGPRLRQALRAACVRPTSSIPLQAAVNSLAEAVVVAAHERLQGPGDQTAVTQTLHCPPLLLTEAAASCCHGRSLSH